MMSKRSGARAAVGRIGRGGLAALPAALLAIGVARARRMPACVRASVTVNRSGEQVYRFWRNLENLPRFANHLVAVRPVDGRRSQWVAKGPVRRVRWDAEITVEQPGRLLAWRSLPGARIPNAGFVEFTPAAGGRGTEVRVELRYAAPAGRLGRAVAALLGEEPGRQVKDDLRRFKQVMETGGVVHSDGFPRGVGARHQLLRRPARPPATAMAR